MTKESVIDFLDFKVFLKFSKQVKNLRLKINKNGEISCSLPLYATQKTAMDFLNANKDWIIKTHKKVSENLPKDDEICLLGKTYKIKFDENLSSVLITDNQILAPNLKKLDEFKAKEARRIFTEFIEKFKPTINRQINKITIRKMQTRWGSCNSRKGYINLNLNLIEKAPNLIEYVILHELTHLMYPHHQSSFYAYIEAIMSDYRQREMALKGKM